MAINETLIQEIKNGSPIVYLIEFNSANFSYYFNTSDNDFTFNEKIYFAGNDLIKTQFDNLENKSNLSINLLNIYNNDKIEIEALLQSSVIIKIATLKNNNNGNSEISSTNTIFNGFIDEIQTENDLLKISLLPNIARLNRPTTCLFSPLCRECFGSSKCGIDINNHKASGQITQITAPNSFIGNHRDNKKTTVGYYKYGIIKMTSGKLRGFSLQIKDEKDGEIFLLQNTKLLNIGDTYEISAGCDKTLRTCKEKFNNVLNFRGEPFINES